jgi:hypothetical protein
MGQALVESLCPGSGILVQFHKVSIILDGDKKATCTKEKILKILRDCHDKSEELKQAGSCNLPISITLGVTLLWKVASKKKAQEDKRLQVAMNGYEAAVGMQATRAPDNFQSTDEIGSDRPCPPTGGVDCTSGWLGHGCLVGRGEWLKLWQCSSEH